MVALADKGSKHLRGKEGKYVKEIWEDLLFYTAMRTIKFFSEAIPVYSSKEFYNNFNCFG